MRLDENMMQWDASGARAGSAFERLGPHAKRLLHQAWAVTYWTDAQRRSVVATLFRLPAPRRESGAAAMLGAFNPEPLRGASGSGWVTLNDLEPHGFLQAFVAKLPPDLEQAPVPAANSKATPNENAPSQIDSGLWAPCPAPANAQEQLRRAAVAYFAGRLKPFTEEEVQDLFSVSRFTIARMWRDAGLKRFVKGKVVRYRVEDVYKLLERYVV